MEADSAGKEEEKAMSETEQKAPSETAKPKTLVQKLASIVAEIDNVDKRGRNEFQKYAYVKAADVAWLVRKALSERNVYLVADVIEIRNYEIPAKEGHMQAVDVKMQFSFFDGDAPETLPIVLHSYGTGTDKGDKAVYKAMTGALKYGLRHAFLIPDESDPEADSSTDKAVEAAKAVGKAKVAELQEKLGKSAPEAQQMDTRRIVWIKVLPNSDIAVNGFLADNVMADFLRDIDAKRKPAKTGGYYYQFEPRYLADFKIVGEKQEIELG